MAKAGTNAGLGQWTPNLVIQAVILAPSLGRLDHADLVISPAFYGHYIPELHRPCIHEVVYFTLAHSSGITFLGRPTLLGKVRTIGNLGH